MYGVFQRWGACEESIMANVRRMRPLTIRKAPVQSILILDADAAARFSLMSDGIER